MLESFGSSISGYLTYTYNSANGNYTDYGWQSYIDAGGNLMDMQKSISFSTKLLPETQLTLVDEKTGKGILSQSNRVGKMLAANFYSTY